MPTPEKGTKSLVIPASPTEVGDLLTALLGGNQTTEKKLSGDFCLSRLDLEQLDHLLEQRVGQQNDAHRLRFSASFFFQDDVRVTVDSVEQMMAYQTLGEAPVVKVTLSWEYLIQFNDRSRPEKQTVDLVVQTSGRLGGGGAISITVAHSARTWAEDVISMFSSFLTPKLHTSRGLLQFLEDHVDLSSLLLGISTFSTVVLAAARATSAAIEERATALAKLSDLTDVDTALAMQLAVVQADGFWAMHYLQMAVLLVVGLTFSIASGLFLAISLDETILGSSPSMVVLGEDLDLAKKKFSNSQRLPAGATIKSFLFAVVVGVAANLVVTWL